MEAAKNGTTSEKPRNLIPCPQCNLSFCCSPAHWEAAHWEAARALHFGPCEDAHDHLSHCEMNREVRGDVNFEDVMAGAHDPSGQFMWAPERIQSAWTSLAGLSWEGEFGDEMRRSVGVPAQRPMAPWIRAASDNLTMAMTILYGLEKLNDDDAWTRKHTLTVHVSSSFLSCLASGSQW
jgi:splicing suppressor protein 51